MLNYVKLVAIFIVFGLSTISGVFSCITVKCLMSKFGNSQKFKRVIGSMNCFAGGVFFATCILDIVPEARENMEAAKEHWGWSTEYPLSELLVRIGFLMILTLEHSVQTCFQSRNPVKTKPDVIPRMTTDDKTTSKTAALDSSTGVNHKPKDNTKNNNCFIIGKIENNSYFDDIKNNTCGTVDETCVRSYTLSPDPRTKNDAERMFEDSDKTKHEAVIPSEEAITTTTALESLSTAEVKRTTVDGLVLLVALSLHMIFDGLSLGLLKDNSKIWNLLLALSLHKVLVFFTIGLQTLELLRSMSKAIFVILILALVSPIGIIIGESINSNDDQSSQVVAGAILQGIAAGTFLYVTFFEILQQEFKASGHDLIKVLCTIIGFSIIGALVLLENDAE